MNPERLGQIYRSAGGAEAETFVVGEMRPVAPFAVREPQSTGDNIQQLRTWAQQRIEGGAGRAQLFREMIERGHSMRVASRALDGFAPRLKLEGIRDARQRDHLLSTPSDFYAFANIDLTRDPEVMGLGEERVQVYARPGLLSTGECSELIARFKEAFAGSPVIDQAIHGNDGYRTSSTVFLRDIDEQVNQTLVQRVSGSMGIDPAYCEGAQIQRYFPNQEYKVHSDFFDSSSPSFREALGEMGQRTWTCLIYLNDNFDGGQTRLEAIETVLQPVAGCAVFWNNLTPLGAVNRFTSHTGMPVVAGSKYVLTIWFRERPAPRPGARLALLQEEYHQARTRPSHINEHLELLHQLALEVDHVTEFGVWHGLSTRAFLAAGVTLRSYDLVKQEAVERLFQYAQEHGQDVSYRETNVLQVEIEETDLLFIDTWHAYEQLRDELARHASRVRRYIAFHDTQTFGTVSEEIEERGPNGISVVRRGSNGLLPALIEFVIKHNDTWRFRSHQTNNNGLTVIERFEAGSSETPEM